MPGENSHPSTAAAVRGSLDASPPHAWLVGRRDGEWSIIRTLIECVGFRIFVERILGPNPERPTILFVNGALTTTSALRWAIQDLTEYNIVAFDFPHFGQSNLHNPGVRIITKEEEASIVLKLCDLYRPDYIVSLSWGGTSTLLSLVVRPPSVKKAIVSSYSVGLTAPMRAMAEDLVVLIDANERDRAARLTISALGEHLPERLTRIYYAYFMDLNPDQLRIISGQIRYMLNLATEGGLDQLAAIDIPVLFGNGSADRFTSPTSILPMQNYVAGCRFAVFEGAGHFLAIEGKKTRSEVVAQIRRFFAPQMQLHAASRQ